MPALVAVMIMVSIGTFSWRSIANIRVYPWTSSVVMLATVAVVVFTHNLAYGVLVGVLLSGIFFAWKIGQLFEVTSSITDDGRIRTYVVSGQVFFASTQSFVSAFDFQEGLERVVIDLTRAHFWDISAVSALDKVVLKFRRDGTVVDIVGMNDASATMVDRLAVHDKSDAIEYVPVTKSCGTRRERPCRSLRTSTNRSMRRASASMLRGRPGNCNCQSSWFMPSSSQASRDHRDFSGYFAIDAPETVLQDRVELDEMQNRALVDEGHRLLDIGGGFHQGTGCISRFGAAVPGHHRRAPAPAH